MKKDEKSNDLITTRNTHSMEKNEKRWKKDMKKKAKKKKKGKNWWYNYDKKHSFYQKYLNQISHAIQLHSFQSLKFT